jgi:UDP-N-acetylglucosamine 2-epimerase (non-hydrolysing)/GDP/UDP-N,N'-diacetylbacillosamine 2-epimerase (hydrolysing)
LRSIGVVTTSRADYTAYRPLLKALVVDPEISVKLYVSGMHLSPEFGLTVRFIENDGIEIIERIEMLISSDTPEAIAKSMGLGLIGFGQAFSKYQPDILVVLGDRYEMLAAALAALPFKIPVAHLCGGELTQGAIDDALRHSMTKLSHLHFTATEDYAHRVIQLGEDPARVFVSGEPSLDHILTAPQLTSKELQHRFGVDVERPFLLVTFHPVTLEYEQVEWQIDELLAALEQSRLSVIFTMPNADTAGRIIVTRLRQWVESHPGIGAMVDNFGAEAYHSVLRRAVAVVGNSSSGLIEAPSFKVPAVNIGIRQRGRIRAASVIDVGHHRAEILAAIQKAASSEYRKSLRLLENPYASKTNSAVSTITNVLKRVELGNALLQKKFHDL